MSTIERTLTPSLSAVMSGTALLALLCSAGVARAQTPPASAPPATEPAPSAAGTEPAPAPDAEPEDPPPAVEAPPPPAPLIVPPPAAAPPAPGVHGEKVAYEAPKGDVTTLTASGGGSLNGGNTNSYSINVGADLQLIRQPHGFAANVGFAYGVADVPTDTTDDLEPIVRNLAAKARYDFFLTQLDAIFAATVFRWDPFAGIDRRNQGQLGYLRYLYRAEKQRFWAEVGYDLTSDDYGPVEGIPDAALPDPESQLIHSARLFLGYENTLNSALTYLGGLEALMNVEEPKDTRLNFASAIRSQLAGSFALELKLTLAFDNVPATTDAEKLDTVAQINLIYQLI